MDKLKLCSKIALNISEYQIYPLHYRVYCSLNQIDYAVVQQYWSVIKKLLCIFIELIINEWTQRSLFCHCDCDFPRCSSTHFSSPSSLFLFMSLGEFLKSYYHLTFKELKRLIISRVIWDNGCTGIRLSDTISSTLQPTMKGMLGIYIGEKSKCAWIFVNICLIDLLNDRNFDQWLFWVMLWGGVNMQLLKYGLFHFLMIVKPYLWTVYRIKQDVQRCSCCHVMWWLIN